MLFIGMSPCDSVWWMAIKLVCVVLFCLDIVVGRRHQREFDDMGYIEYQPGSPESNILLAVPHGGSLIPGAYVQFRIEEYLILEHRPNIFV